MKKGIKIVTTALIFVLGSVAIVFNLRTNQSEFLSASHKIDANTIIVESWLPEAAFKMVKAETKRDSCNLIITTGVQTSELDYCMMAMNGYLIFYPGFAKDENEVKSNHLIEVTARSKMGGIYCSHFNIFINDSLMADFNAAGKPRKYGINWYGALRDIDSVVVQFTNDMFDDKGDRNLYVREVTFDNKLKIPYQYHSVFDIGTLGGTDRILNNYFSQPQIVRNNLISEGIDSSRVIAVTGKRTIFNRTLVSALAVKRWLETSDQNVKGLNIISMGVHSRRTWLTYRRVLDKSYNIGIISLPDTVKLNNRYPRSLKIFGETLDLIYYWIILIPYLFD